ncbi:hypothetical protein BC792_105138 [Sphingobacterium allocomposti]|uniref:Uncharacterized protein n=1 Tax=Sphingobacterium allocomposti TaxID=415956 RepID=A0A5S5DL52_9SPHI|nr:hypothetical protein BC792_105138 [Sphingobacterium composti Yoo et al. 2007 non Ten et al. 2007]
MLTHYVSTKQTYIYFFFKTKIKENNICLSMLRCRPATPLKILYSFGGTFE